MEHTGGGEEVREGSTKTAQAAVKVLLKGRDFFGLGHVTP